MATCTVLTIRIYKNGAQRSASGAVFLDGSFGEGSSGFGPKGEPFFEGSHALGLSCSFWGTSTMKREGRLCISLVFHDYTGAGFNGNPARLLTTPGNPWS